MSEWIEATQGAEPCPTCGFEQPDVMVAASSPARFFVECASTKCLVAGPSSATKETAVEKWNEMAARLAPAPTPPTAAKRNTIRMLAVGFVEWSDQLQRSVFSMRFVADDEARLDPDNGPRIRTGTCPVPLKL